MEEAPPIFNVGHHEASRTFPVTKEVLARGRDYGYDFMTTPITTAHFHSRVLALLSEHISSTSGPERHQHQADIAPLISPLEPVDTPLAPRSDSSTLVACASTWTDLCSPDPLIANLSQQVLALEVAYAAFCGIGYIILPTPLLRHGPLYHDGLARYARAVKEALNTGSYLSIVISMPLMELPHGLGHEEIGHLGPFARDSTGEPFEVSPNQPVRTDSMGSWDAWNVIRTFCKYSSRLFVGLMMTRTLPSEPVLKRWFAEPLRILNYYPKTFSKNQAGFPVLQKGHQALLSRYVKLGIAPWLLLCDVGPIPAEPPSNLKNPNSVPNGAARPFSPASSTYLENSLVVPNPPPPTNNPKKFVDLTPHLSYMRHLQRNQPSLSIIERFGAGYQDYLQAPLQPLADNLESITYEVFEKDPVKYDWYEKAIHAALTDWIEFERAASGPEGRVVIAVVGAGRGPLVHRALKAADNAGVPIELWAVEKNPNAYVMLKRRNEDEWDDRVSIVKSDMRSWAGPLRTSSDGPMSSSTPSPSTPTTPLTAMATRHGQVDILISELLGSFADNELSPECLDGISHVLSPQGISIPSSYSAHLSPISAPKLHADVTSRSLADAEAPFVPYVVMFHAIDFLSTEQPLAPVSATSALKPVVEKVWEFDHPVPAGVLKGAARRRAGGTSGGGGGLAGGDGANEHNSRFSRLKFVCAHRGVVNGLAGYFETVLYDGRAAGERNRGRDFEKIELSTNPNTMEEKSRDMISWFPIYFPIKEPMYIPDNSEVVVNIWRQTDDRKVWYEWMVETFVILGKHNHRIRLGSSDLHSSKKNGCLM